MSKMTLNIKCTVVAKMADSSVLFFKVFGNQSEVSNSFIFLIFSSDRRPNSAQKQSLSSTESKAGTKPLRKETKSPLPTGPGPTFSIRTWWLTLVTGKILGFSINLNEKVLTNDEYPERNTFEMINVT